MRPAPSEAPLECLRRTLDETWDDMGEAIEAITPLKLHLRMCQIIEITPSLLAAHLRHSLLMEQNSSRRSPGAPGWTPSATRGPGCWSPPSPA